MKYYHCLTGKTEEKKDGALKSNDDSFRTGQKSTLAEGTEFQNCVILVCTHVKVGFWNRIPPRIPGGILEKYWKSQSTWKFPNHGYCIGIPGGIIWYPGWDNLVSRAG